MKNEIEECFIRSGEEVYILLTNRLKKYDGEYKVIIKPLLPGYVFVSTEDDKRLRDCLRKIKGMLYCELPQ